MSYVIYTSSGTVLTTVPTGKTNTATTSLTLVGRDVSNYGGYINQNLVYMLSNFASSTIKPPNNPITGQLWFDTTYNKLKVLGNNGFHPVGAAVISPTQPVGQEPGEFWYDSTQVSLNFVDDTGQYNTLLTVASLATSEIVIKKLDVTEGLNVGGNVLIEGNLHVNGAQTVVNSTVTSYVDPVIDLGTGPNLSPLVNVDEFDKGIIIHYNSVGGTENDTHAFMGYEHSQNRFMFKDNIYPGGEESFPVDNLRNTGTYAAIDAGELRIFGADTQTTFYIGSTGLVIESAPYTPPGSTHRLGVAPVGVKTWTFNNGGNFIGTATNSTHLGNIPAGFYALNTSLVALGSSFNTSLTNATSYFNQKITLLNDSTSSLAQSITSLGSSFNTSLTNATSYFRDEITLLNTNTASLALRITTLGSSFTTALTSATSHFNDEIMLLNSSTSSLAQRITTLDSSFSTSLTNAVSTFNDKITLLNNSTASLAQRIISLDSSFTTALTSATSHFNNEITLLNSSTSSLAQSITTLGTSFNSSLTSAVSTINQSLISLSDSTSSLAQSVTTLGTTFNSSLTSAVSTINQSLTSLSNNTASLAQSVTNLGTNFNTSLTNAVSTINQSLTALSNSTSSLAQSVTNLGTNFNTSLTNAVSTINQSLTSLSNNTASLAQSVTTLGTNFNTSLTNAVSTINQALTSLSDSTSSLAQSVTTLGTNYTNLNSAVSSKASISYVDTAVSNSTASVASSLQQLKTDFNTPGNLSGAGYTGLTSLVSSSTGSFASRVSTLETNYTDLNSSLSNKASITYVDTAVSSSTGSFASRVSSLETSYTGINTSLTNKASITDVQTAVSNSTASIASALSSLKSDFATPGGLAGASYNGLTSLVTNSTGSFASQVNSLQSSYNGLNSSVTTYSSSINGLNSKYGVKIDNNGSVTGYELNSGASGSSFVVKADEFKVYTGGGAVVPFSVVGSTVYMQNVEISSTLKVGTNPALSGTGMTGIGSAINSNGTFAMGNSTKNITFDGTVFTINGDLIGSGNINAGAVTSYVTNSSSTPGYLIIPLSDPYNVSAANINYLSVSYTASGTGFITINWDASTLYGYPYDPSLGRIIPVEVELWRDSTFLGNKNFIVDTPPAGEHTYTIKAKLGAAPYTNGYYPSWAEVTYSGDAGTYTDTATGKFVYEGQINFLVARPRVLNGQITIVEYKK